MGKRTARPSALMRGLVGVAVAAAAAACGASSKGGSTDRPWSTSRAEAFANAVILTPVDVAGFTGSPHHETAAEINNVAQLATCAGAVDPVRRTVDVHSDDYSRGSGLQVQSVGSSVDVLPSASLAEQDFAKFTAPSASSCVSAYAARALAQTSTSPAVRFGSPSAMTLTPPPGTATNSFGYRFVIPLSAPGVKVSVYVDLLFHRVGPAEVAFTDSGIETPFPAADRQRLFSLLVRRGDAHAR